MLHLSASQFNDMGPTKTPSENFPNSDFPREKILPPKCKKKTSTPAQNPFFRRFVSLLVLGQTIFWRESRVEIREVHQKVGCSWSKRNVQLKKLPRKKPPLHKVQAVFRLFQVAFYSLISPLRCDTYVTIIFKSLTLYIQSRFAVLENSQWEVYIISYIPP